jgi:heme-degrading monooxygenase HmoA
MGQYIAMNRFRVKAGHEEAFTTVWRERETHLAGVPGFVSFRLLRSATEDGVTLFSTHTLWASEDDFRAWTKSEAFERAHQQVRKGAASMREMYAGPPKMEGFTVVLEENASAG